jgi:hypothetical protein
MWRRIIITIALMFVVVLAVVVILVALFGDRGLVAGGGAALLLSGLVNLALADDVGGARRHLSRALNQPPGRRTLGSGWSVGCTPSGVRDFSWPQC